MKSLFIYIFFLGSLSTLAQSQLNSFKYIIVPKKFDTFKNENQHQTSTLVKYLFVQNGFNTVYDFELPPDLVSSRCNGLLADVIDGSTMFVTKASIVLKDCEGNEVYRTQVGSSKEKDFKAAYGEALRKAFKSLTGFTYQYTPKEETVIPSEEPKAMAQEEPPIAIMEESKEMTSKEESAVIPEADAVTVPQVVTAVVVAEKASTNETVIAKEEVAMANEAKTSEVEAELASETTAVSEMVETTEKSNVKNSEILYAQAVANGFQLVDSTPKVQLVLQETSDPKIFIVSNESGNGVVFQKAGQWYFEYYEGDDRKVEKLEIKF